MSFQLIFFILFLSKISSSVSKVVCPNSAYSCKDGQTCCELRAGGYGCCPMPQATCCSDEIHCCPHGTTCDMSRLVCVRPVLVGYLEGVSFHSEITQEMMVKTKADFNANSRSSLDVILAAPAADDFDSSDHVECTAGNGDTYVCPDNTKCCPDDDIVLCCPDPQGVCCANQKYCCPLNFICSSNPDETNCVPVQPGSDFIRKLLSP